MIPFPKLREVVQVVDLRRNQRILCCDPLGCRHQLRTHGTGQGDQDLQLFFVKYFSLKKASEFPFFSKGFSLPSAGIMHPCA